ncbi:MAG TPA: 6-bladed beta-propeller [Longimicrobiales bacterium]
MRGGPETTPGELAARLADGTATVLDVRAADEWVEPARSHTRPDPVGERRSAPVSIRNMRLRVIPAVALPCVALAACSPDAAPAGGAAAPGGVNVRDSAGIRIVENAGPLWTEETAWTLAHAPAIEIEPGGTDSTQYYLYGAIAVERLGDGRLVVANRGMLQLLVFDSLGTFLRSVGRRGGGPGEFTGMYGLYRCAGDALVVDESTRLSFFDAQLHFVRAERLDRHPGDGYQSVEGIAPDCSALLVLDRELVTPPFEPGAFDQGHTLYWSGLGTGARDTVARFPGPEAVVLDFAGVSYPRALPWGRRPVWVANGEEVYLGLSDGFEIRVFGRRGGLSRIIRWAAARQPVTRADRALFAAKREQHVQKHPEEARVFPTLDAFPSVPDAKPAYSRLLVDDEGNLWVREYPASVAGQPSVYHPGPDDDPVAWWVFDPTGRLLGRIHIPAALRVRGVQDDYIIGVWWDELDVEHVQLYRLRKPERG